MPLLGKVGGICHQHEQLHFEWKVEDVFSLSQATSSCYHSPAFYLSGHSFCLRLYPNGESEFSSEGWIGLYLMSQKNCPPMKVQYSFGFKTAKGDIVHKYTNICSFTKESFGFGKMKALETSQLRNIDLTPSDVLTISVTLKIVPNSIKTGLDEDEQQIGWITEGKSTTLCKELFWKIDNALQLLDAAKGFLFYSPPFSFNTDEGQLSWDVKEIFSKYHLFLYAMIDCSIDECLNWSMGILCADGAEHNTYNCQIKPSDDSESTVCWAGPLLSELLQKKEVLCPDGVLTFFVRINVGGTTDVSVETDIEDTRSNIENEECQHTENTGGKKVLEDIGKLWRSGENSDVVVQVQDVQFKAHMAILGARTPVLAAMFQHNTIQKATGVVAINDCEPSIFGEFLYYVYTGSPLELTMKKAPALYAVANRYLVEELKALCLCCIQDNLSVDTFCDTVLLALNYGEAELMEYAVQFATKNIRKIINSGEWLRFINEYSTSANEILIKVLGPE